MSENENTLLGHVSELDISDVMKRAYFLIPDGEATFAYYSAKAYYNEEGFYMYDADNIRQFLPESWLVLRKHVS
jgi:hypothetical protein